jgi:hypothetical protein
VEETAPAVAWTPLADVTETDDAFHVEIELLGVKSRDIDVESQRPGTISPGFVQNSAAANLVCTVGWPTTYLRVTARFDRSARQSLRNAAYNSTLDFGAIDASSQHRARPCSHRKSYGVAETHRHPHARENRRRPGSPVLGG